MAFHHEPEYKGNPARMAYLCDIEELIKVRREKSIAARERWMANLESEQDLLREAFKSMLGWPLSDQSAADFTAAATMDFVASDEEADIYRVQVETLPGFKFRGILLKQRGLEPKPLVICQHGKLGTPEMCSGFYDNGDTHNYHDFVRRIYRRGVHVFAPQLLLWDQEGEDLYRVHYDRELIDRQLKQLGGSIAALEIHCIMKSIDALGGMKWVDQNRIAMAGLSYGGFYTLYTAAADPRIKSALSVSFFNDRIRYGWPDWIWNNAANTFLDAEVGALIAPRPLHIHIGSRDGIFSADLARTEIKRLKAYYQRCNASEKLTAAQFDGGHEFPQTDQIIEQFCNDLKDK